MILRRAAAYFFVAIFLTSVLADDAAAQSVDTVLPPIEASEARVPPVPPASMNVYPPERRPFLDGGPDETAMWNAINAGQDTLFEELVLRAKRLHPGWHVPASMIEARAAHATQARIRDALASGDDWRIIDAATSWPSWFDCNHEGNVWMLYDAYRRTGATNEARSLINRTVRRCHSSMRLTAIQKANENFGKDAAIEWSKAPGAKSDAENKFIASLTQSGSRGGLDAYGAAVKRIADATNSTKAGAAIPKDMYVIQEGAAKRKDAGGAMAAGWWLLNSGRGAASEAAFRSAIEWGGGDKARSGLIYALIAQEKIQEADALAAAYPGAVPDYSNIRSGGKGGEVYEAHKAGDYRACVAAAQKPDVADDPRIRLMRGWCLMELGEEKLALSSFEASFRAASDQQTKSGALQGRIAAASKLEMNGYLAALAREPGIDGDLRQELSMSAFDASFMGSYNAGDYMDAIDAADRFRQNGGAMNDGQKIIYGWALHNAGRCGEARDYFKVLAKRLPSGPDRRKAEEAARITGRSMPYNNPFGCLNRSGTPPPSPAGQAEENNQFDWL